MHEDKVEVYTLVQVHTRELASRTRTISITNMYTVYGDLG